MTDRRRRPLLKIVGGIATGGLLAGCAETGEDDEEDDGGQEDEEAQGEGDD